MQPLKNVHVNNSFNSKEIIIYKSKERLGKENPKESFSSHIKTEQNEKIFSFSEEILNQYRYLNKLIVEFNTFSNSSSDNSTPKLNLNPSKNSNIKDIPIPKGNSAYSKGKRFE